MSAHRISSIPVNPLDTRSTAPPAPPVLDISLHHVPRPQRLPKFDLHPVEAALHLEREARYAFVNSFGETLIALVQVEPDGTLLQGFRDFANDFNPDIPVNPLSLPFETTTRKLATRPPPAERKPVDAAGLRYLLMHGSHYVLPIRKRRSAARPATHRVSAGRARNSDLVLRDASVSKFHAWFECDERGKLFVADARSKNGTQLNAEPIKPRQLYRLTSGDTVKFGDVRIVICAPDILWDAVHHR